MLSTNWIWVATATHLHILGENQFIQSDWEWNNGIFVNILSSSFSELSGEMINSIAVSLKPTCLKITQGMLYNS